MVAPTKINFKIYQGSTFKEVLRWESATKAYALITGITKSAPVVITSVGHGIPVGWRAKITNVLGMKEINSAETYHTVTGATSDSVTINTINALGYTDYTSGGVLEYNVPVNLTGYTARMQLRLKLEDPEVLYEMTTENSGIIINNIDKTITLSIPASATTLFNFSSCVYSIELISPENDVTPFANGVLTLVKEVTR